MAKVENETKGEKRHAAKAPCQALQPRGARACVRSGYGLGRGQDIRAETFALGAAKSHPLQKAIQEWADDIEKASNGTIKYKIYPAQQLGKAFDHYDMAKDGIADFVYVNPGYQPGRFPIIAAGELPFLVGQAKGGNRAIDAWYRKYAATEMKDTHYCFSFVLDPLAWHSSKKKIVVPGDIAGMKIRPAQGTIGAWVTLLGGTNVQSSAPEVRDIHRQGRRRRRAPFRGALRCCSASTR